MDTVERGLFKVVYSGSSRPIAERLLTLTEKSYPIFRELFAADRDLRLEIYWADRNDWAQVPPCRHRTSYGMPHMTRGEGHTHFVILPAANIDPPDALTRLLDPLLDPTQLTREEVGELRQWLSLDPEASDQEMRGFLSSPDFYVDYLVEIVALHEIMHDFCFEFGIPENYAREGRQAWWVFEGLAQWSVLWVQRRLGNDRWAGIHERLYRWMYRTGRDHPGNASPVEYANYAWFHGALVEMFCHLEERCGKEYGPAVLRSLLTAMRERDYLTDREVVEVFTRVAGQDLSRWFQTQWRIE
jgi:hypothetical protein